MTKDKQARQIDADVCRKVFGLPVEIQEGNFITLAEPSNPAAGWWFVPEYSTDISAANSVVEELCRRNIIIAESGPKAICLAALRAIGTD